MTRKAAQMQPRPRAHSPLAVEASEFVTYMEALGVRAGRQSGSVGPVLVVEGDSDAKLWTKYLAQDALQVEMKGKSNALDAARHCRDLNWDFVLALVDADGDWLHKGSPRYAKLCFPNVV